MQKTSGEILNSFLTYNLIYRDILIERSLNMRITERRLRRVIRQVLEEEGFLKKAGSFLKSGVKSAIYGDYGVALDKLKQLSIDNDYSDNYLVELQTALDVGIEVKEEEIFINTNKKSYRYGKEFVIMHNQRTNAPGDTIKDKLTGLKVLLNNKSEIPPHFKGDYEPKIKR